MTCERFERGERAPVRARGRAAIVVGLVAIGLLSLGASPAPAADAKMPKLLLLPIVVHSAEDPEYLRDGLSDMLAARFSRIGGLRIDRRDDPDAGTTSVEAALAAGRKSGADYVLFGSFTRFGQGASLDVQCAPVSTDKARAPLREIFVHSGSIGEIIPDLDELAGKVSRFARGENVTSGPPAGPAAAAGAPAPSNAKIDDLYDRVEALEAAITELLDRDAVIEEGFDEAETIEEVR